MVKFLPVRGFIRKAKPILRRLLALAAIFLLILAGLGASQPTTPQTISQKVQVFTQGVEFDFVRWTLDALRLKLLDFSLGASKYLIPQERKQLVLSYLELVRQIKALEIDERQIYADPSVADPLAEAMPTHRKLEALYNERARIAPMAEAILESQVNTIANDLGLDLGGQAIPPVLYHSTPLPLLLVVSPRDVIRREADVSLVPELTVGQQVNLEEQVDQALDVSSLVVPIGGVGAYPTMVNETSNLEWLSEVVAHEWIHNFLTIRPLGMNYLKSPELRTMNETAASIAGKEIGRSILEKYYPEMVPPPAPASPASPTPAAEPPAFDFNTEMHTTRVNVDQLLAEGKIDEAEAYMEQRRQYFWENGYSIRKLNQAYFAFYGAYADEPLGPAGEDPVGAAVRALRAKSPSLAQFLFTISQMTSFEQLKQAVEDTG
ncbi:MAG: hypothetical protein A2W35_14015 [Chloroflexi bacterium RBG_16_57_11]|nr:MAG: hypothetical protein A2W35_14015 [Chloroflexi bacterium RBG_16_57_11]